MRQMTAAVFLLAGCASTSEYVPGPPTTVREPTFSGRIRPREPTDATRIAPSGMASTPPPADLPPPMQPDIPPWESPQPFGARFLEWLHSGRGWAWGAARHGPIRDEGLDRLMVDTLTSGRPGYSREPVSPASPLVIEPWTYPPSAPYGRENHASEP